MNQSLRDWQELLGRRREVHTRVLHVCQVLGDPLRWSAFAEELHDTGRPPSMSAGDENPTFHEFASR